MTIDVNISEFVKLVEVLASESNKDTKEVLRESAALFASELSKASGPKSLYDGQKNIRKEVNSFFSSAREMRIEGRVATPNTRWIAAGPEYLIGVSHSDFLLYANLAQHLSALYVERNSGHFGRGGKSKVVVGSNGKQSIYRINRLVVTKEQKQAILDHISKSIGKMKASWQDSAEKLGSKSASGWIERHVPSDKAILGDNIESNQPEVTIGSSAPGVTESWFLSRVDSAEEVAFDKMSNDIHDLMEEYARQYGS